MTIFLLTISAILVLTALYSINSQERMSEELRDDLRDLILEAKMAREDLEGILLNVQAAGEEIIKTLDDRLNERIKRIEALPEKDEAHVKMEERVLPFNLDDIKQAHPYLIAPRLRDLGYSTAEIAELLGRSSQEIEMILTLVNRKQKCG